MKIYIASPYTLGDVAQNVRRQIFAAEKIVELGHIPYVPLLTHFWHYLSPHIHAYWMKLDAEWLAVCDAILRLPGESVGADREIAQATGLGKQIFYSIKDIPNAAI